MSGGVPGVGVRADQIVNQQEAQQGLGADGKAAPAGTSAVPIKAGQSISEIMQTHGLDWNNADQRKQFLQDNPQFTDQQPPPNDAQGNPLRSADLVYPGENIYLRPPVSTFTPPAGSEVKTGSDGQPVTGWVKNENGTDHTFRYYVNGLPTTETTNSAEKPAAAPEPRGTDYASQPINENGWYVTAGSSQGVLQGYFVGGYQIEGASMQNGKHDAAAPVITDPDH